MAKKQSAECIFLILNNMNDGVFFFYFYKNTFFFSFPKIIVILQKIEGHQYEIMLKILKQLRNNTFRQT